jgi:hypothetical protein
MPKSSSDFKCHFGGKVRRELKSEKFEIPFFGADDSSPNR